MKITKLSLIAASVLLFSSLNAETAINVNQAEIESYSLQKYRVNYNTQTEPAKISIANEYNQTSKLADYLLKENMKNDSDLAVATKLVTLEIWAQKLMSKINPTNDEIKKVYDIEKPMINARYSLRNILVKDEVVANKLFSTLTSIKDTAKRSSKFKELVRLNSLDEATKNKEGQIGFVEEAKLDKVLQDLFRGKKGNDIVKISVPNGGTQIFLVEEYQPSKQATIEESKQFIVNAIRQKALTTEIDKILQGK